MNKWQFIGIVFSFLLLSACSGDRVFEEFYALENEKWAISDTAKFSLDLPENIQTVPLLAVRFNETYPFSNLYLRLESKDSTGKVIENKLLNVPVFETKSGMPIGKGFGNSFTKYDTLPFSLNEKVKIITLTQYMRQESVEGLEAVGLKILKK